MANAQPAPTVPISRPLTPGPTRPPSWKTVEFRLTALRIARADQLADEALSRRVVDDDDQAEREGQHPDAADGQVSGEGQDGQHGGQQRGLDWVPMSRRRRG